MSESLVSEVKPAVQEEVAKPDVGSLLYTNEQEAPKQEAPAEVKQEAPKAEAEGEKGSEVKAEDGKADEKPKAEGAPEKYEAFTVPEGFEVDKAKMEAFEAVAKEAGLKQETAQKLVTMQTEFMKQVAEEQTKAWEAVNAEWRKSAENDKEFGGAALGENLALARNALDAFGGSALREVLDFTGAGNHPEVIRAFVRIGKAISEGKIHVGPAKGGNEPRSLADRLYDKN